MMDELRVSAPGSIMISGEHAVVYGHPAMVCAVEQRMYITMTRLDAPRLDVVSEIAPPFSAPLDALPEDGPMRFVAAAIRLYRPELTGGLALNIRSEIQPNLGLGSSAAVTMAVLAGVNALCGGKADLLELHRQGLRIVRGIQGRGSGADLAASLWGGALAYQIPSSPDEMARVEQLPALPQLSLCYTGYKTPTGEVLARVAERMTGREAEFADLYTRMGACSQAAIDALRARDYDTLAENLILYQEYMRDLGVSDARIEDIISAAQSAQAVKISGSGLGDCVVALGDVPQDFTLVKIAQQGVVFHD